MALPHLLLLPGLACDAEVWKHQARALAGIASVEIPDYGSADSLPEMARVAIARAPESFAVAGHSMGGRVALEILRRVPERVAGLAILDTAYQPWIPGEAGEREKTERAGYVKIAQSQGMREMARQWLQKMVHPSRLGDAPLIDAIIEMFGRKSPDVFAGQIKALLDRPDAMPVLVGARCPTMVMCGREDAWALLEVHRRMAALVPHSRLVVIENCGHMAPMERPEAVTAALAGWFSGLS
jgi:pimeloyl-ACP methyl ester carboxylesterase